VIDMTRRNSCRTSLLPVVCLAAAVAVAAVVASTPRAAEPRVVEITAKRFQFTPNLVTLRKDEPVILRLRSEDVVHGFFQRPLGIDTTIEPGKVREVAITPHQSGRFVIICHHFCGAGHGNMKMTLVVE
jgi:cytochrome c oxidase subunit 2